MGMKRGTSTEKMKRFLSNNFNAKWVNENLVFRIITW
jgi:hypothetical protein